MKNPQQKQRRRQRIQAANLKRRTTEQERFTEPMTGKRARKTAKAAVNVEYNPVLRSIAGEKRGSVKRQKEAGQWYNAMANEIAQRSANGAAATAAAGNAIDQQLATVGAQDQAHLETLTAQNNEFAKLTGGPTNATGLAQAASMAGARRQQAVALNSPLVGMEVNRAAQLGGLATATRMRGREATGAEKSRREKIAEDLRAGKKAKGQAYVGRLNELREGAVKNRQTDLAFGLDKRKASQDARDDAADNATAARNAATAERRAATGERGANTAGRNARTSERGENRQQREAREERENPNKGGRTPTQVRDDKREVSSVKSAVPDTIQRYKAAGVQINTPAKWAELVAEIVNITGADYAVVKKAVNEYRNRASQDPNGASYGR